MLRLTIFILLIFFNVLSYSQSRDFIRVEKRNGKGLKTLLTGMPVIFELKNNDYVNGYIENIQEDSIYVKIYERQFYVSSMGFNVVDTVAIHLKPFYYKDIRRVKIYDRRRFIRSKMDRILLFGGAIYFVTNIVTGLYRKEPIVDNDNLKRLGIAALAIGTGVIMRKKIIDVDNHFSTKRQRIVYVKMN